MNTDDKLVLIRTDHIHQVNKDGELQGYSDQALSIVANCKNAGIPEGSNAISMTGKSKRGTIAMQLFAVYDPEQQKFIHSGFRAHGCIAMIACASVCAGLILGKNLNEALAISVDDIRREVGSVPSNKVFTFYLAHEAIRAAVADYLLREGRSATEVKQHVDCSDAQMGCWMCEDCSLRGQLLDNIAQQNVSQKVYKN